MNYNSDEATIIEVLYTNDFCLFSFSKWICGMELKDSFSSTGIKKSC